MDLETIKKTRELAKGNTIKIINDNQHIFYANLAGDSVQIIWDDANRRCICIRANQDQYIQDMLPCEVVVFDYDEIQHLIILTSAEDALEILNKNGTGLSEEDKKQATDFINGLRRNRVAGYQYSDYSNISR